jgi:hypothetical protein
MTIPNCYTIKLLSMIDYSLIYHNCFLGEIYKKEYNSFFTTDIDNGTIVAFDDFTHRPDLKSSQSDVY